MPQLAVPSTKIEKIAENEWVFQSNFFFENHVKNPISHFKLDGFRKLEVESCRPTRISGTWVGNRRSDSLRKKKTKKIQKLGDFRFFSEISGMNVGRPFLKKIIAIFDR